MNQPQKRILFVSHTAEITGPTHSLQALLPYLKEQYAVAVVSPEEGPLTEWLARQEIPAHILPDQRPTAIARLTALVRRGQFDLVYANNPSTYARNGLIAARLLGKPAVWHFRSIKWHWDWREGIFLRLANRVIAVSQACAQPLLRFAPGERVRVIHNGVDAAAYQIDREPARRYLREQLRLPESAPVLISVGHLMRRKAQTEQVALMRSLAGSEHTPHLVIAGNLTREPDYAAEVQDQIARAGLAGCVHVLGLRADVPQLLGGADVYLHTPKSDAHPRGVLEAMAAGLPVVAYAVDGVRETVVDGETGCLIEPGDGEGLRRAVERLLGSPQQMTAFGAAGRRRVQAQFSAAGTAAKIERVLEELLEE